MPLVKFQDLGSYQQHLVREVYSDWDAGQHEDFAFWVRKDGRLALRRAGRHQMTDEAAQRRLREIAGGPVRTKGDLRDWKPGHSFTFIKD